MAAAEVTCDNCTGVIHETPLVVPRMPSGVSHFHPKGSCHRKAVRIAALTWPARNRRRRIEEAQHGPRVPVS